MLTVCYSRALVGTTLTGSNEPLYGRTDNKSPTEYSSTVHVAVGEEGRSTRTGCCRSARWTPYGCGTRNTGTPIGEPLRLDKVCPDLPVAPD